MRSVFSEMEFRSEMFPARSVTANCGRLARERVVGGCRGGSAGGECRVIGGRDWERRGCDGGANKALNADFAALVNRVERRNGDRIEALAGRGMNDPQRFLRIVGAAGRGDSWSERRKYRQRRSCAAAEGFIVLETVRIAAAIERLVVQFDAGKHLFELRDRAQDVGTLGGVGLHDLEFFRGKRARLFENAVFDADLAHVMQVAPRREEFR